LSSILEALKKAEKESPQLDLLPEFKKLDPRKAISRHAGRTAIIRKLVISALVLVVAGLGLWFAHAYKDLFFNKEHDHQPAPTKTEVSPAKPLDAAAAPEIGKNEDSRMKTTPDTARVKEVVPGMENVHEPKRIGKREFTAEQSPEPLTQALPDDARFRLEAIAWAERPESRFAVINGQLIRIGGSMEGISVTAIERDHVAVRSNRGEWRMNLTAR
jgi:hypothetical protein